MCTCVVCIHKAVVIKQPGQLIQPPSYNVHVLADTPDAPSKWCGVIKIAVYKRQFSQGATICGLCNSVEPSLCLLELDFSLLCDILGEWT